MPFARRRRNMIRSRGKQCGAEMVRLVISCCAAAWGLAAMPAPVCPAVTTASAFPLFAGPLTREMGTHRL